MHQNAFSKRPKHQLNNVALRALTLLAANRDEGLSNHTTPPNGEQIDEILDASISSDKNEMMRVIQRLISDGCALENIISDLIPAVARKLGNNWVNDTASFSTVTIGCARLQASLHHLEAHFSKTFLQSIDVRQKCLILTPQNAQHTLGAVVLSTQLRHAGADVQLALDASPDNAAHLAGARQYDSVMISAALGQDINDLRGFVSAIRSHSPKANILLGGSLNERGEALARATGVNHVTSNWRHALKLSSQGLPQKQAAH